MTGTKIGTACTVCLLLGLFLGIFRSSWPIFRWYPIKLLPHSSGASVLHSLNRIYWQKTKVTQHRHPQLSFSRSSEGSTVTMKHQTLKNTQRKAIVKEWKKGQQVCENSTYAVIAERAKREFNLIHSWRSFVNFKRHSAESTRTVSVRPWSNNIFLSIHEESFTRVFY